MRFHYRKMQLSCLLSVLLIVIAFVAIRTVNTQAAHAAASAQVTVNVKNSLGTIPATAYGDNQAVWDGGLLDSSLPGLIAASGAKIQRYPGGSLSDAYHWQSNTTESSYANPSNTFDAFMNRAQQAGTQPLITVDYGSGTPQEAAGWVHYANKGGAGYNGPVPTYAGGSSTGHTYGIKYWEIGNEIPGNGTYGADWEVDHNPLGPTTYANRAVTYSQAMKAVDPTIKVGLVLTTPGSWPDGVTNSLSPQPWTSTSSMLRGVASNKCLDVSGAQTTNGTQMIIWDCNGGANQQWTLQSNGELQVYGNKCLDVLYHATKAGSKVGIWDCNGGANQQWTLNSDGTIVGRESGLCLDVTGGGTANGTAVEIWSCSGSSNQKWTRQ